MNNLTMGRTGKTASSAPPSHRHRHHHYQCGEALGSSPKFKAVKPRVGSQYQTRVPKRAGVVGALRPAMPPERFSTQHPHFTERQVEHGQGETLASATTTAESSSPTLGYGPIQYQMPPTSRGGLLVHRPMDSNRSALSLGCSSGGRRKRRHEQQYGVSKREQREEHFLEYATIRHGQNVEMAELMMLVASSAGCAYKEWNCCHRKKQKKEESWMQRHDDLCGRAVIATSKDNDLSESEMNSLVRVATDQKKAWKSILQSSQEMEVRLECDRTKPMLQEILAIIEKARLLTSPCDLWGARHVAVSKSLHQLLDHVEQAYKAQAKLLDMLYDRDNQGVDLAALKACMKGMEDTRGIQLDYWSTLEQQVELAVEWQTRLDSLESTIISVDSLQDDYQTAQELLQDASRLGIRWRGQVLLKDRMEKANELKTRLTEWQQLCDANEKQNFKVLLGLVRDANRLNFNFPQVSALLKFHQLAEAWMERANVAIRSKISLTEIESLLTKAETMPLDLTEYTDKLQSRMRLSQSWLSHFQDLLPAPFQDDKVDYVHWMSRMRQALLSDDKSVIAQIHDLAMEGMRIPVEIDCVKLLLVEMDAKIWMQKAAKWIPSDDDAGKRAKLVDIRDHVEKADALRKRLVLSPQERDAWVLQGEAELKAIIEAADDWFEQYEDYVELDNRRSQERICLSLVTLRKIVQEGNLIYANVGTGLGKMSRILSQAEQWYEECGNLLFRCGLPSTCSAPVSETKPKGPVSLEEINAAVEKAEADVSLDLEEVLALRDLGEKIQKWQDRVSMAAPKRSKRVGKGQHRSKRFSVDDIVSLIDEASSLPTRTQEDVKRLKEQLSKVHEWRLCAQHELSDIAAGFLTLQQTINAAYGLPGEYNNEVGKKNERHREFDETSSCQDPAEGVQTPADSSGGAPESMEVDKPDEPQECMIVDNPSMEVDDTAEAHESTEVSSQSDTSVAESDESSTAQTSTGGNAVYKKISSLAKSSKLPGIRTAEEEVAEGLEKVAKWIVRSLKCIDSPNEVYKKNVRPFDEFIETGEELLILRDNLESGMELDDADLIPSLTSSWGGLVSDQLVRLKALKAHRDEFVAWSKEALQLLSSKEKKATLEALNILAVQSNGYPSSCEMVQRVRSASHQAKIWKDRAGALIDSEEKPTLKEAKDLVDECEKLNFACDELKVLQNAIRSARSWASKVKRCKPDQGGANSNMVSKLIDEHDSLLISMPDEFSSLSQALKGYCLCRRPYDGFMVECDGCGEWYHGPCVGLSEAQAERREKFLCVRCCIKRVFTTSTDTIASIIRKWTDPNELKKQRQHEASKHQRKVRKEQRDIEKLAVETESLAKELSEMRTDEGVAVSLSSNESMGDNAEELPPALSSGEQSGATDSEDSRLTGAEQSESKESVATAGSFSATEENTPGTAAQTGLDGIVVDSCTENSEANLTRQQEIEELLSKDAELVRANRERLAMLAVATEKRKEIENAEDAKRTQLRTWSIRVRSLVLVPSTTDRASASLPLMDGSLSDPMLQVMKDADTLGISQLPDVVAVGNAFKCLAWCSSSMHIFARRPSFAEVEDVVSKSSSMKLPEEKSVRMMRSMLGRARFWLSKVSKALAPMPGETAPVNVDTLKGLIEAATAIPFTLPAESCLQNVVDDKGTRYCVCGGPHIGSFMLGCDKCERWYHGRCVHVSREQGEALDDWVCPPCRGVLNVPALKFCIEELDASDDDDMSDSDDEEDISSHAPIPSKLWPPFGLMRTPIAIDALGETCCAIADDVDSLTSPDNFIYAMNGDAESNRSPEIAQMQVPAETATPDATIECVDGGLMAGSDNAPSTALGERPEATATTTTDIQDGSSRSTCAVSDPQSCSPAVISVSHDTAEATAEELLAEQVDKDIQKRATDSLSCLNGESNNGGIDNPCAPEAQKDVAEKACSTKPTLCPHGEPVNEKIVEASSQRALPTGHPRGTDESVDPDLSTACQNCGSINFYTEEESTLDAQGPRDASLSPTGDEDPSVEIVSSFERAIRSCGKPLNHLDNNFVDEVRDVRDGALPIETKSGDDDGREVANGHRHVLSTQIALTPRISKHTSIGNMPHEIVDVPSLPGACRVSALVSSDSSLCGKDQSKATVTEPNLEGSTRAHRLHGSIAETAVTVPDKASYS